MTYSNATTLSSVAPTFRTYILGLFSNYSPSRKFYPTGFRIEELGPDRFRDKGHQEVLDAAREMRRKSAAGKCPFYNALALDSDTNTDTESYTDGHTGTGSDS